MNQLRFLLHRAALYRGRLATIGAVTALSSLAALAVPWLAGQLIGGMVDGIAMRAQDAIGLLVLVLVLSTAFTITGQILSLAASGRILSDLRVEAYARLQSLPMAFHDRSRQGDLLAVTTWEVNDLSTFLTGTLARLPAMAITAVGSIVLMFLIDPMFALVVPLFVPLFYLAMKVVGRVLRSISRHARKAEATVLAVADSDLQMLPAIRAFAVEDQRQADFAALVEQSRVLKLRSGRYTAALGPIIGLLAALVAVAIVYLAGQTGGTQRTPADLFSFLLYAALLTRPVSGFADVYGQYQVASGTLSRLQAVLRERPEPGLAVAPPPHPARADGAITFDGVSFAYPARDRVLNGATLAIAPGEIVALTGENGAGKSTLVRLLLRFYDPQTGRILLDGQDISTLNVRHLRRQIGYVPQRPLLFNGTVRDNILLGTPDAGEADLARAITLSQAADFIAGLPHGLETEVGDHGVRLSGGQGQRIALARALLGDPPVLIFDEATSMYDLKGEAAFVDACQSALEGRTVILITHRPASLALADRVLCVENGIIVGA